MSSPDFGDRVTTSIHIGGVWVSRAPSVVSTVLGSCISVCLRDPVSRVGGMNHFMLPETTLQDSDSARYGVNAMEILINRCMNEGANRFRLEAKVFGGGHVLKTASNGILVPHRNIEFALTFLDTERIRLLTKDVGGYAARSIHFFTDNGRVLLKRLSETGVDAKKLVEQEQKARVLVPVPESDDNVTLF